MYSTSPNRLASRVTLAVAPPLGDDRPPLRVILTPGDAGIYQTLSVMESVARDATRSRLIPMLAAHARYPSSVAAGLWSVLSRVVFRADETGVEALQHPTRAASIVLAYETYRGEPFRGDCDDRAMLGASLALVLGVRVGYRVVGQRADGPFQHVYLVVQERGGEVIAIDPQETAALGDEPPHERAYTHWLQPLEDAPW
jgi:hypothetical protein